MKAHSKNKSKFLFTISKSASYLGVGLLAFNNIFRNFQ